MKTLCAIDGSESSDAAVALIGQLLSPDFDQVTFYYSPPTVNVHGPSAPSSTILEQASQALVENVFRHGRSILPMQLAEQSTTVTGRQKPRFGIPAAAKVQRPDLIAVGARGTSRFGLPRLGSVSRAVVHFADLPVLVARTQLGPESEPLQILLCCDQITHSSATAAVLNQLSLPHNAVGRVAHVLESILVYGIPEWIEKEAGISESEPIAKAYFEEPDDKRDKLRQQLEALCHGLPPAFHSNSPVVLDGVAGEQIVKYVESAKIDLVVLGSHVSSPLARMLIGATSEYVLAHATCSVLIVPHHEAP